MSAGLRSLLGALLLASLPAVAQPPEATLADRIVAVVDDDPILESDLQRAIAFGVVERLEDEEEPAYRERVLRSLIEQQLRFHEIDRFGFQDLPLEEVNLALDDLRGRWDSEAAFEAELERLGLSEDQVRELLARQMLVLVFVEERLGPRVFVSLDSIEAYYEQTLVPEMQRMGHDAPPMEVVREQIRDVLREARLNEEIEVWTRELELAADIVVYFDDSPDTLPPVID